MESLGTRDRVVGNQHHTHLRGREGKLGPVAEPIPGGKQDKNKNRADSKVIGHGAALVCPEKNALKKPTQSAHLNQRESRPRSSRPACARWNLRTRRLPGCA